MSDQKQPEPPFTPEQIAWLDARYRQSIVHLEQMLEERQDGTAKK